MADGLCVEHTPRWINNPAAHAAALILPQARRQAAPRRHLGARQVHRVGSAPDLDGARAQAAHGRGGIAHVFQVRVARPCLFAHLHPAAVPHAVPRDENSRAAAVLGEQAEERSRVRRRVTAQPARKVEAQGTAERRQRQLLVLS